MSVHSGLLNLCQENVYFKRNFLKAYTSNAENLYKGDAWNSSKRHKGFLTVFPVFLLLFFQITFDLLLTNTSRLDALKYTDQPIWLWFLLIPRAKQTTNSNMVWYLNINKLTYSHWSKHVGENLPSAMHFIIFVTFRFFFSEIARLCSFIIDTFVFCT